MLKRISDSLIIMDKSDVRKKAAAQLRKVEDYQKLRARKTAHIRHDEATWVYKWFWWIGAARPRRLEDYEKQARESNPVYDWRWNALKNLLRATDMTSESQMFVTVMDATMLDGVGGPHSKDFANLREFLAEHYGDIAP